MRPGTIPTLWLVLTLIFIKGILFVVLLPPWQGPDEPTRFEAVYLTAHGPWWPPAYTPEPTLQSRIVDSMRQFQSWKFYDRQEPPATIHTLTEANLPSGPSILYEPAATYFPFTWLIRLLPQKDILSCLYAGRFLSLVLHIACTLIVASMAHSLFISQTSDLPGLAVTLIYGLHPQLSFLAGSLHADNLGYLLSAAILYLVIAAAQKIPFTSMKSWGLLVLVLLPLTGLSAYLVRKMVILIPFTLISLPILFWPKLKQKGRLEAVSAIGLFFMGMAVFSSFFLYRHPELVGWRVLENPHLARVEDLTQISFGVWLRYLLVLFTTFWMALGSLVYKLSLGWMVFLALSFVAVLVGWVNQIRTGMVRMLRQTTCCSSPFWIHGLWTFLVFLSVFMAYGPHRPNPEGRYLLSAMPSLSLFWFFGLAGLAFLFPEGSSQFVLRLWGATTMLLSLAVLFSCLIPFFYLS